VICSSGSDESYPYIGKGIWVLVNGWVYKFDSALAGRMMPLIDQSEDAGDDGSRCTSISDKPWFVLDVNKKFWPAAEMSRYP
jgi:hypothetical protein